MTFWVALLTVLVGMYGVGDRGSPDPEFLVTSACWSKQPFCLCLQLL